MALSPEVSIGYSIISMRMEPIKAFHVCHTIEFCRYRKAMVNLCLEANSHTIGFSQRRKAMVNLCQEANSHTIGFSQRLKAMDNLCQQANSHTIRFSQRRKAMVNLCQEANFHTIEFSQRRKTMVNLCQEAAFHSVPGAAPSACRRDSHLYAFKFPYTCTKCTTRNTTPSAANSTFRLHSPIAT